MSHEVYKMKDGKDSMGYVGQTPWHGLGQKISEGADIDTWVAEAGMNYRVEESPVVYLDTDEEIKVFSDQKVLYRDDTGDPLSIVHKSYKVVQPREVVEFFQDLVEAGSMTMETAGTLKGGRIQWALARIGKDFDLNKTGNKAEMDLLQMYALLATSCDKSLASTGRLTSVRVVCWNTLSFAYLGGDNIVKVNHRTEFDDDKKDQIKQQMGLIHEDIDQAETDLEELTTAPVKREEVAAFFTSLFAKEKKDGTLEFKKFSDRKLKGLMESYETAPGSNLATAKNTLWGAVNAATHFVDHGGVTTRTESKLRSAWFGRGEALKNRALSMARGITKTDEGSNVLSISHILDKASDEEAERLSEIYKKVANF